MRLWDHSNARVLSQLPVHQRARNLVKQFCTLLQIEYLWKILTHFKVVFKAFWQLMAVLMLTLSMHFCRSLS